MKKSLCLTAILFTLLFLNTTHANAQTEGFDVKTPTQKTAGNAESFVEHLTGDSEGNHKDAIPKELICSAKCVVVIPNISIDEVRKDFEGVGLMSCLKADSDDLTPPLFYEINHLDSFYEGNGGIVIFVTKGTDIKTVLVNGLELTQDNTEPGKTGGSTGFKPEKPFVTYTKPEGKDVEGYDLSGGNLVYANRDTFDAYQGTIVPIDILLYTEAIPPELRGFNAAVKEWRNVCN